MKYRAFAYANTVQQLPLVIFMSLSTAFLCTNRASATPPPGYTLAWSDEFDQPDGSMPDPKTWNYVDWDPGQVNNELQAYSTKQRHLHIVSDPDATDGKALEIRATTDGKGNYWSGRINTAHKFSTQYGYIEARIKLTHGQGTWPAFWMLGDNDGEVGWPRCGEIDIMENKGKEPGINHGSMHGPGYSGGHCLTGTYTLPNGQAFSDGYHTFAILWEENKVTFYVDDAPYETRTPADLAPGKDWVYNHPFYIVLNLAIGGQFGGDPDSTTTFPQDLLVDYVRVYKPAAK